MEIIDDIAEFSINICGDNTRNTYMGNFKVKCLTSPYEQLQSDKLYRELLGDNPYYASDVSKNYAFTLSQLKYRIIESPPFWANPDQPNIPGGHIKDSNVLSEVLEKAIEARDKFILTKEEEFSKMQERIKNKITNKEIKKELSEEEEPIDEGDEDKGED